MNDATEFNRAIVLTTWHEVAMGGKVAVSRKVGNLVKKRQEAYGAGDYSGLGVDMDWLGIMGEIAVAKYLDTYWPGLGLEFGAIDAGVAEVRAVDNDDHRLIVHPKDRDNAPFVSALVVRSALPLVTLRGWMMGRDAKQPEFWSDPTGKGRPAFFPPNKMLRPMPDLLEFLHKAPA